jgi:hypothetical protein
MLIDVVRDGLRMVVNRRNYVMIDTSISLSSEYDEVRHTDIFLSRN